MSGEVKFMSSMSPQAPRAARPLLGIICSPCLLLLLLFQSACESAIRILAKRAVVIKYAVRRDASKIFFWLCKKGIHRRASFLLTTVTRHTASRVCHVRCGSRDFYIASSLRPS